MLGCAEAAANADHITLPSGRLLPVAPLELIAVLKLIAFAGRQPAQTKDADDLLSVLRASSDGVYGDEIWDDELAMRPPTSTTSLPVPTDSDVEASLASAPTAPSGSSRSRHRFIPPCGWPGGEPTASFWRHGWPDSEQTDDRIRP